MPTVMLAATTRPVRSCPFRWTALVAASLAFGCDGSGSTLDGGSGGSSAQGGGGHGGSSGGAGAHESGGSGHGGSGGAASPTCFSEIETDTYAPGMSKVGAAGYEVVLLESVPAPPIEGDNEWTIRVLSPGGDPIDGLAIDVFPFMPDHGHGTAVVARVAPAGMAGAYVIAPVNLFMSGVWVVRLKLVDPETMRELDAVKLTFCV